MGIFKGLAGAAGVFVIGATIAFSEEQSSNRVAVKTDWNVFVDENPKECWSVTIPKESVNTRNGNVVAVNRGQTLLMVFYRPSIGNAGQVAFTGGYPFADDSTVKLEIGDESYDLVAEGEWAWPASVEDDAKIIAAMKRGVTAVASGVSGRGTNTKDSFSLLGFTAAVEDAQKRCSG